MDKVKIFGVEIFKVDFQEAVGYIRLFLKKEGSHKIYTPNTEIVMEARDDSNMKNLINSGDLVTPDGIGLIYASKMRKNPLKERVTGFDLSMELLNIANKENLKLYLLGAKDGVAKEAAENIKINYPGIEEIGYHHGYFLKDPREELAIIEEINRIKPHIVFVGLGFPKQELWIDKYASQLDCKIIIGNGGVIDILSGRTKRAPDIFIKLNLEWLYRLITQPSRIGRQLAIPKFLFHIAVDKNSVK